MAAGGQTEQDLHRGPEGKLRSSEFQLPSPVVNQREMCSNLAVGDFSDAKKIWTFFRCSEPKYCKVGDSEPVYKVSDSNS